MSDVTGQPSREGVRRVLIVDDQPAFRRAARRLLETRGYDVVAEAGCGTSALEAVERHAPQGVLLDVRLGQDDGFSVCSTLTRARPGLAVLLASDTDYEHSNDTLAQAGACGFIRKSSLPRTDLQQFWPLG